MTLAAAKKMLGEVKISLRHADGEYRVNFRGGSEGTAYYTNDLNDAIKTGLHMMAHRVTRLQRFRQRYAKAKRRYGSR